VLFAMDLKVRLFPTEETDSSREPHIAHANPGTERPEGGLWGVILGVHLAFATPACAV
jgi:hypothetical protein